MQPVISVIIPTLNAERTLGALLLSLQKQSAKTEQIVIDSESEDRTLEIAQQHGARTILIRRQDFDHGATRNRAAAAALGDILIFMTQDALPVDNRLIEALTASLNESDTAASYGRQIPYDNAPPTEKFARFFNYPLHQMKKSAASIPSMGIKTFFFSNVCSAIRKEVFWELKGFPEHVIMNEDLLFAAKAIHNGYGISYVPQAMVFHSHEYGLSGQFKRYFDIGVCFRDNDAVLNGAAVGNEGIKFVLEEFHYLLNQKAFLWFPYVILELMCRYGGFNCGKRYMQLPDYLVRRMSLHRNYWRLQTPLSR